MGHPIESISDITPSRRLWRAISFFDLAAHEHDNGSAHDAAESLRVTYRNIRGNEVTTTLDYVASGAAERFVPHILSFMNIEGRTIQEEITFLSDRRALVEGSRQVANEAGVIQMANRVETMLQGLLLEGADVQVQTP